MPRRSSGARLWFDKARQTYSIIDGKRVSRTGCGPRQLQEAQAALEQYIVAQRVLPQSSDPLIADVLKAYADEHLINVVSGERLSYDVEHLESWWGDKPVSDIDAANCRAYIKHRNAPTICRRELGTLNAAVMHWHREHERLRAMPVIVKPPNSAPRSDYITRSQAARLLWAARRQKRLSRFILIGWYTGTRHTAICGLRYDMIDFETGVMLRRRPGVAETRKKTPPVKVGSRLLAHLRRWRRLDGPDAEYLLTWGGKPVKNVETTWVTYRRLAGLPEGLVPHMLRHSRATYMMRQRVDPWQAARSLGMSLEMLQKVYGHHHPDWQAEAAAAR